MNQVFLKSENLAYVFHDGTILFRNASFFFNLEMLCVF
jgi:hypothetical protein